MFIKRVTSVYKVIAVLSFGFLLLQTHNSNAQTIDSLTRQKIIALIADAKQKYTPDDRTEYFAYDVSNTDPITVGIFTTSQKAGNAVLAALKPYPLSCIVTIQGEAIGEPDYGIINLSVATNRREPKNAAEITTQTLLGTPVHILAKEKGYSLVRTPEGYLSWTNTYAVKALTNTEFTQWQQSAKVIYTATYGHVLESPLATASPISDIVAGDILQTTGKEGNFYKVIFPDQRVGYIPLKDAADFDKWKERPIPNAQALINTGKSLMGIPYLWGGYSVKGLDCSGFTKTCYFMNGIVIPRDAAQQAEAGKPVDIYENGKVTLAQCLKSLRPGDLLFFATQNIPNATKITHTAMYMGNGEFIQSSAMVKISSLIPAAKNYDNHTESLLKARRFLDDVGADEIVKVKDNKFYNDNE